MRWSVCRTVGALGQRPLTRIVRFRTMATSSTSWSPDAARALYRKSVEACERFFADRKRPDTTSSQAFFDLCLAEYAVRKHLSEADCFSSREALLSALRELLIRPVEPPILPCRADQYLVCQKQDIEFEIRHLTSEQEPQEKSWFQKLFRR